MIAHDRSSIWVGLADLLLCVLSVVIVAVAPKSPAQSGVEMKALYLLTIEWDVGIDADADIHLMPPRGKPVFYASREVGCATLDRDNRGFLDSIVELLDGSKTKVMTNKETIAIRCIEPGRYDLAANLYAYRAGASFDALPDRAELVGFVARDDNGLVDLWLRTGDVPRAYETKLDAKMKKALREARDAMAQGRRPLVAKAGKAKADRAGNPNGIGDHEDAWVVDPDALSRLPGKK